MNILLAGHKGFLGTRLKEMLAEAGHNVWLFNRGDSLKWGSVAHCDVFINAAGETHDIDRMAEDNLIFAARVADACHVFKKRLIHIGSISELVSTSHYANTKKAASDIVMSYVRNMKSDFCVVQPATIFGPGDKDTSVMGQIWNHFEDNKPIISNGYRDWVYIDDLCEAIITILKNKSAGEYYGVGYGVSTELRYIVDLFAIEFKANNHMLSSWLNNYSGHWCSDTVAIKGLGWKPKVSLPEGVKRYIDWKMVNNQIWLGAEA